jgi:hypothetical protein
MSVQVRIARLIAGAALVAAAAGPCAAQVTPAAGYTPPDDTPRINVGATIFMDYTWQQQPKVTDADKNNVSLNSFQIGRSYINVTGQISHIIAFRITPDITRETGTGSSLNGSYTFRLKYAFAQFNLDDWMTHGSWVRFGQQQTPYVDYAEGIYRYRFQGTIFPEREGFLSSADVGGSFHSNFKSNYGDVHVGVYNGETYSKPEVNDQKAFQIRGTLRPFATASPVARGLRLTGFYDADHVLKNADRMRGIFAITYEHQYVSGSVEYLNTKDQALSASPVGKGDGWSVWVNPKSKIGWEALVRYDHFKKNKGLTNGGSDKRTIAGISYWFPHQGNVSTAILFDVDDARFDNFTPSQPTQRRIALHGLVNF